MKFFLFFIFFKYFLILLNYFVLVLSMKFKGMLSPSKCRKIQDIPIRRKEDWIVVWTLHIIWNSCLVVTSQCTTSSAFLT